MLKIITVLNWIVIGVLTFLVIAEALSPSKGGGDAAGRGMGQALYFLAIVLLVVLLILNLIPYNWGKYAAFALLVIPLVFMRISPIIQDIKRRISYKIEDAKPIFPDKERDSAARAIRDGRPEKLKEILAEGIPKLNENGELLGYAFSCMNDYRRDEKMDCIRQLFQAGATPDSLPKTEVPAHIQVAASGNYELLAFLLDHGADPNAYQFYLKYPIIFEAVGAYRNPEKTVEVLLDHGADVNAKAVFDDDDGPITPLIRAALLERWGVCRVLIAHGADLHFQSNKGKSFAGYFEESSQTSGGYSGTDEDLAAIRAILSK